MPKRNLAWILVVAMIALLMWQLPQTIARRDAVSRAFGPLIDARTQIEKRSVYAITDDALVASAVEGGVEAMIAALGDPFARYMNREEYARFQRRTRGMVGGIGVEVAATESGLEIISVQGKSPAEHAGIEPGDIVTHIDNRPTRGLSLVEVVNGHLNGSPGSRLTLTIRKTGADNETRELSLVRVEIEQDPIRGWHRTRDGGWKFMFDPDLGIGYVRIARFAANTARRLDAVTNELGRDGLRGLILDLRDNPGGLRDSALDVADRFLTEGLIVSIRGRRSDTKQWFAEHNGTYRAFPLAVLINGSTASAAEIVAGALQDHRRALVVGERSYGKGSVQEVIPLAPDAGAIKITTAHYYLPSGHCVHRTAAAVKNGTWGVRPRKRVSLTAEQRRTLRAAWRDMVSVRPQAPTTQSTVAEVEPTLSPEAWRLEADRLRDADPQLDAAVQFLRRAIQPTARRPASGGNGISPVYTRQRSVPQVSGVDPHVPTT